MYNNQKGIRNDQIMFDRYEFKRKRNFFKSVTNKKKKVHIS